MTPHGGENHGVCLLSTVCGGWRSLHSRSGQSGEGQEGFFKNVVVICDVPLTARRGSWPCFLPLLLGAESSPKEMSVRDTGEA